MSDQTYSSRLNSKAPKFIPTAEASTNPEYKHVQGNKAQAHALPVKTNVSHLLDKIRVGDDDVVVEDEFEFKYLAQAWCELLNHVVKMLACEHHSPHTCWWTLGSFEIAWTWMDASPRVCSQIGQGCKAHVYDMKYASTHFRLTSTVGNTQSRGLGVSSGGMLA